MRGILAAAGYVPHRRLRRSEAGAFLAGRPSAKDGGPTRAVAGPDEDTTTMAVEAARLALRPVPDLPAIDTVWLATATPAYLDKTNATAVHAALRLPEEAVAFDGGGGLRSGSAALRMALAGPGTTLVVAADERDGLPGSADETGGGDAAAAVVVGEDGTTSPVLAELLGAGSATDEFVDRWRTPGDRRSRTWEERFGETRYVPLARRAAERALAAAGMDGAAVDRLVVTGMHPRARRAAGAAIARHGGVAGEAVVDDRSEQIGQSGTAHPLLALVDQLEQAAAGTGPLTVLLVHLADGADALVLRTTPAVRAWHPARPVAEQAAAGVTVPYGKFLAWRGMLQPEPPRRPGPSRVSSPAAARNEAWKFGFVGSRHRATGTIHLPPARMPMGGGALDDMEPVPMAEATGRVATFTVDTMVHSPDPPVVFAVVDFDGGGRFPVELTDVEAGAVTIGMPVELTFRRLSSADGIHDYFWKARPRAGATTTAGTPTDGAGGPGAPIPAPAGTPAG